MDSEVLLIVLFMLLLPYGALWRSIGLIKRHEDAFMAFYYPLREKRPRSYVKQNKVITYVRRKIRMDTDDTIHWVICFCHYMQIYCVFAPVWMLFLLIFLPLSDALLISWVFGDGVPLVTFFLWIDGLSFLLDIRCQIIKKKDPKYAKREIKFWYKYYR
jgi:hypothetical protein